MAWDGDVLVQSQRDDTYAAALDQLIAAGQAYPCACTRSQLAAAPRNAEGETIYPGTCRPEINQSRSLSRPTEATLRLNVTKTQSEALICYQETGIGPQGRSGRIVFSSEMLASTVGDFVIARRDMGTSYHLAVVLDDAAQGVTHVMRGADLTEATMIHVYLQRLIGLPTATYHHHHLIRDEHGKRLAKRDDARALSKYRTEGATPADIRRMIGLG